MSGRTGEELEVNNICFVDPPAPDAPSLLMPLADAAFAFRPALSISSRSRSFFHLGAHLREKESKKQKKKAKKKLVNIDEGPPRWRRNGAGISDNKKQPLALILPIRGSVVFLFSGLSRNVCVADCIWRFRSDGEVVPAAWARTHKPNKPKNKTEASKASSFGSPH